MRSCRTASVVASVVIAPFVALGACREPERPEVPPVTAATPPATESIAPSPSLSPVGAAAESAARAATASPPPVTASFVDVPAQVQAGACDHLYVAVVKGKVTALKDAFGVGDVLLATLNGTTLELGGSGTVVIARRPMPSSASAELCRPGSMHVAIARAASAPKLEWASGSMRAYLDVGMKLSPELYLGRLEGTGAVAEHTHPSSWEVLAAVDASGTFVLEGIEGKLGPRQIVVVPPGARHAWRPDPGSKLAAVQIYMPPGPEQRFVALAAADKAERDAGARDAR